jgi:nucleoside-diphosphate-sugar epimerase
MFSSNIKLVYDLIQYVKNTNNKMIHIGSSAEYGKKNLPSKESDKLEPRNAYEASKAAATMLCVGYAKEYNLPISVIRPYSVYGIYEKDYRLFPKLFDAFYKNIKMTLNQGYHDFIYVKDFINGIDLVLNTTNAINGDIINMGSGKQYSNFEIYDIFKNIAGKPAPVELNNKFLKKFENDIWVCDTTYSKNVYGFETKYSIEQGIQDYINTRMEKNI